MRIGIVVLGLICLGAVVVGTAAMQDEDDVRGAFISSRDKEKPANTNEAKKPNRRRPKQTVASATTNKPAEKNTGASASSEPPAMPASSSKPVNVPRLGLGMTLFMRDSNGLAVRTDPNRVFRQGDRVRVLLETNADGYLYIFNTTDDGPAVMIYPHADLDEGGNYLQAHVPFEIPSGGTAEERLRWFAFDEVAGTERLYFVFTREPLQGIPIEDDLIAFCRDSSASCPVRPSAEVWDTVQKEMHQPFKTDRSPRYGNAQTEAEHHATTRGLGLSKDDPQPSMVMMASSQRQTLVAMLDLIHK